MTWLLLFIGVVIGLFFGLQLAHARKKPYLASAEYWIYLPEEKLPPQDEVITRMLRYNPHGKAGHSPIGPKEGLLFSDVRTHIALVLRRKNTHVFRPDLFDDGAEITPEILQALSESKAMAKVRYVSEEPLPDDRHIQFLAHAAGAIAALGHAKVIYDVTAERLVTVEQFEAWLDQDLDATRPDMHVRILWRPTHAGGIAETRGLAKVGVSELKTAEMEHDNRVLVSSVLEEGIRTIWEQMKLPELVEVSYFGDMFRLQFQPTRKGPAQVVIMRVQTG